MVARTMFFFYIFKWKRAQCWRDLWRRNEPLFIAAKNESDIKSPVTSSGAVCAVLLGGDRGFVSLDKKGRKLSTVGLAWNFAALASGLSFQTRVPPWYVTSLGCTDWHFCNKNEYNHKDEEVTYREKNYK